MSIIKTPGKGLEIEMADYTRLVPGMGMPDYWHPQNQMELRRWLHPFLPKMEYQVEGDKVVASLVEDGRELLAESSPAKTGEIPVRQLAEFQKKLDELRQRLADPEINPDVKTLVEGLRLPDPAANPELFRTFCPPSSRLPFWARLIGRKPQPRLAILWGMESKADSSIPVAEMDVPKTFKVDPKALTAQPAAGSPKKWLPWGILILLLIIIAALLFQKTEDKATDPTTPGVTTPTTPGVTAPTTPGATGQPTPGQPADQPAPAPAATVDNEPTAPRPAPAPGEVVVPDARAINRLAAPAVCQVLMLKDGQPVSTGTAFCIHPDGLFVTNHHVIDELSKEGMSCVLIDDDAKTTHEVQEVILDMPDHDLAVLSAPCRQHPFLKLQRQMLAEIGDSIYVVGYPEGLAKFFTMGVISSFVEQSGVHYVFHTAPVSHGSSGSPIMNSKGEVVAVVVGNFPGADKSAQSMNVAVWIGELPAQFAKQPATGAIQVPANVEPAPKNDQGHVTMPNSSAPEAEQVEVKGVNNTPVTVTVAPPLQQGAQPQQQGAQPQHVIVSGVTSMDPIVLEPKEQTPLPDGRLRVTFEIRPRDGHEIQAAWIGGKPVTNGTATLEVNPETTPEVQVDVTMEGGKRYANAVKVNYSTSR